jgi:hypothetical protein
MLLLVVAALLLNIALSAHPLLDAPGFTQTQGGAGGREIAVTHLGPTGAGSLTAAINASGPRIIVFKVAGVIDLDKRIIRIRQPYLTIAGETAPSPGITLIKGGISVETHDVVIRHLRVRPGDVGEPRRSGWEVDAITTSGPNAHDIIIEHCSLTWSTDENLSVSGSRFDGPEGTSRRVTLRNNLIAECLHDSTHPSGPHSKGSLIHDFCQEIAVIGNLYAHNYERNPYFKSHTSGVIVNNLIYNPVSNAIQLGYAPLQFFEFSPRPKPAEVAIVGNMLLHGPNTRTNPRLPLVSRYGRAWLEGNAAFDREGRSVRIRTLAVRPLREKPLWPKGLVAMPATELEEHILQHVGARPWDRDAIDKRILATVRERKGAIINSQEEFGGYPSFPKNSH